MSRNAGEFREALERSAVLIGGDGDVVDVYEDAWPVHVAIVFDVDSIGPHIAAIYAAQGGSEDGALQEAYEILEEWKRGHQGKHLRELEKEYGDEADGLFMENTNARTWTLKPDEFGKAIKGTDASKYIETYNSEKETFDPRDEEFQKKLLTSFDQDVAPAVAAKKLVKFELDKDDETEIIREAEDWHKDFWAGAYGKRMEKTPWKEYKAWLRDFVAATRRER
jgi:hypothetical protein